MFFKRKPQVAHQVGFILFGLGNPGAHYVHTRHNAGWWALDELARRHKPEKTASLHKAQADFVRLSGPEGPLIAALVKPVVYMNRSGQTVREWLKAYPDAPWAVVYDDIALPPGRLRLRREGSAGGHNGVKSIIEALGGSQAFDRLRIGVGAPPPGQDQADYVLEPPGREDRRLIEGVIPLAADLLELLVEQGFDAAQTKLGQAGSG